MKPARLRREVGSEEGSRAAGGGAAVVRTGLWVRHMKRTGAGRCNRRG